MFENLYLKIYYVYLIHKYKLVLKYNQYKFVLKYNIIT